MRRFLLLSGCIMALAACDRAPPQAEKSASTAINEKRANTHLSKTVAMAEIYGNVDPAFATSVWTRPDPDATDSASFDSVDGIPMLVEVANLTRMGPDRALLVTAARAENPETGEADRCATCVVVLSAFTFERDSVGWRILERQEAAATTNENELVAAIRLLVRETGGVDVTLGGTALRFNNQGRLIQSSVK
jgi:hypothetical protein